MADEIFKKGGRAMKTTRPYAHVTITPKGEAAIQRCVQVFEAVDQSMFEGFRPEETRQACGYLMRMLHNLRGDLPPERMNCQC